MLTKYPLRRGLAVGLLAAAVALAACGGAATSAPPAKEATAAPAATQPTTAPPTQASETTKDENPPTPEQAIASVQASCHPATPQNDPIMAALQPNPAIAPVSATDWAKGPADAAVTLVEYGDFQ